MPVSINFSVEEKSSNIDITYLFSKYGKNFNTGINSENLDIIKNFKHSGVFNTLCGDSGNGFIDAIFDAYNCHRNLVITPDTLWLTILSSLMSYVDTNAEVLRKKFVAHEDKKEINVSLGGNYASCLVDEFISRIMDEVNKNVSADWCKCNFSTSTQKDVNVSSMLVMAGF